ncbi:hypothetical protein [Variovorax boronicumulans]|nr:hypothetical protein [Variovorax boronicumulans]MDP9877970.1 hypothetical protein [Variovorax boronicumulans]
MNDRCGQKQTVGGTESDTASMVIRYLGIEVDDALEISEHTEI